MHARYHSWQEEVISSIWFNSDISHGRLNYFLFCKPDIRQSYPKYIPKSFLRITKKCLGDLKLSIEKTMVGEYYSYFSTVNIVNSDDIMIIHFFLPNTANHRELYTVYSYYMTVLTAAKYPLLQCLQILAENNLFNLVIGPQPI